MTRINCGVKPSELSNKHLLAEHREIKRVGNNIKNNKYSLDNIPKLFTMGSGHIKFFYPRLEYLHKRYESLYLECIARGMSVTYFGEAFKDLPFELYNDYTPTERDRSITLKRLIERDNKFYSNLVL